MSTQWELCQLGDVLTLQRGFDLPNRERQDGTIPIVSSSGTTGFHNKAKVKAPGVVTGRYGTLGEVFYVDQDFWPLNTTLFVKDFKGNDPLFISYFLKTLNLAHQNAAGAVPGLNRNALHLLPVRKPPLSAQKKIANILSNYDRLIENNTRRIQILEEMARSLYDEWFVRFRFPGYEQTKLVDSELGLIPEKWKVSSLGNISNVISGYAFKSKDWSNSGIPVIKIKNITSHNTVDLQETDFIPLELVNPKLKKYFLNNGDFLIAMTGATAGKVGKLRTKEPVLLNQRVAKIQPRQEYYSYIWQIISSQEGQSSLFKLADGAAQPNMSASQIEGLKIILPPESVCTHFNNLVEPIYRQVDNLIFRNRNLQDTRDLLLPKLISGEIDVESLEIESEGKAIEVEEVSEVREAIAV